MRRRAIRNRPGLLQANCWLRSPYSDTRLDFECEEYVAATCTEGDQACGLEECQQVHGRPQGEGQDYALCAVLQQVCGNAAQTNGRKV